MSALEDLAQAVLDGRVSLAYSENLGGESKYTIQVEPAPAPKPVRPRLSPAQPRDGVCGVLSDGAGTYRCSLPEGHDFATGRHQQHVDGLIIFSVVL